MKNSVQEWIPFEDVFKDGVIKLKDGSYVKILKITPINFNLKSDFEKEAILNSYKLFLKTCNFDIQILIQSNKENINSYIDKLKTNNKYESENIKDILNKYCQYITDLNNESKSSSKKFFILIKKNPEKLNMNSIKEELNNRYFKIKECLARCGNDVREIDNQIEIEELFLSFINSKWSNKQ